MSCSSAEKLLALLRSHHITLATAESCTGGMIGETVTSLSGASEVYLGGVISYSNEIKEKVLGVSCLTLENFGAVSVETAAEMAEGARHLTGAGIAVSVTGIAGPTGGTEDKPVGTVCFGIASANGIVTYREQFGADRSRDEIRRAAVDFALRAVYKAASEL